MKLRLLSLFFLGLAASGCGDQPLIGLPAATGAIPEILIVTDSLTWNGVVGDAVRQELAKPILTLPNQQGFFRLRYQPLAPQFLPDIRKMRNVLFIAPITAESPVGDYIRARIPDGQEQELDEGRGVAVTIREDLWAIGQVAVTATAGTDSLLATAIIQRGEELREAYDRNVLAATTEQMFDSGRQKAVEDTMLAERGWAIGIQHDYIPVQDTLVTADEREGHFLRYRRVIPETWRDFFVFTQENVNELPDDDAIDRLTAHLLEQLVQGNENESFVVQDFRRPIERETLPLAGRQARETRGMWVMTDYSMGGPFIRYALVDEETNRLYVYYGMIFSPRRDLDKREFLRQMEAIGTTFRTSGDEARAAASRG